MTTPVLALGIGWGGPRWAHPIEEPCDQPQPNGSLLAALAPAEGMAGAACVGLAPLFDLDVDGETGEDREARHGHARGLCGDCRVLEVCRASLNTLPAATVGVWAGVVLTGGKGHR